MRLKNRKERKKIDASLDIIKKKKPLAVGALLVSSSHSALPTMGPYSDKAHNLGLYPKITLLLVLRSACLLGRLGRGYFSLKITICDTKKFGIFLFPQKISKSS
jgi:hypothetical protein